MYLDPDIQVFSKFDELFNSLVSYDVVLTPHLCSPTTENVAPSEFELMRTGVFNLGFIALNKTNETLALVSWWKDKLYKFGDNDLSRGLFYDQIWMMLAPCFLDNVKILRHLGYNACNWNLHERYFERNANDYIINKKDKLRFFHFSHFKEINLPLLASYNPTYSIENRPDIANIYLEYLDKMNKSKNAYKDIRPYFGNGVKVKKTEKVLSKKENIKWILKHLKLLFS